MTEKNQNRQFEKPKVASSKKKERRIAPRKSLYLAVNYVLQGRAYQDFIRNISRSGIFIETHGRVSVGQKISMTFSDPEQNRNVKTKGMVIRSATEGIGVKFERENLPDETRSLGKTREKRKSKRFQAREGTFAILNEPYPQLGEIVDISPGGLGFIYSSDDPIANRSSELDIMLLEAGVYLRRIPFQTRSDLKAHGGKRRLGVQFGQLTNRQISQLDLFIRKHNVHEANTVTD